MQRRMIYLTPLNNLIINRYHPKLKLVMRGEMKKDQLILYIIEAQQGAPNNNAEKLGIMVVLVVIIIVMPR